MSPYDYDCDYDGLHRPPGVVDPVHPGRGYAHDALCIRLASSEFSDRAFGAPGSGRLACSEGVGCTCDGKSIQNRLGCPRGSVGYPHYDQVGSKAHCGGRHVCRQRS